MKKAKNFLSAILVAAILSGLTLPSLAVSKSTGITAINSTTETGSIPFEEIKNLFRKSNAETSEITSRAASEDESILNKICPAIENLGLNAEIYSDFSDVAEESISSEKAGNLSSSSQSAQINRLLLDVIYYVYDSDDMEYALADPTVTIIDVMNNFTLDDSLEITRDILIESGVEGAVTITSAALARHFYIDDQASISVNFNNVILSGNYVSGGIDITDSYVTIDGAYIEDCYTENADGGGAILAINYQSVNEEYVPSGTLTVTDSTFEGNEALIGGGAIASYGQLSISNSTITGNSTEKCGGGIMVINWTTSNVTATISGVTIDGNHADYLGGGVIVMGITATINESSEITNNTAEAAGGICSLVSYTSVSSSFVQENIITSTEDEHDDILSIGGAGILSAGRLLLSNTTVSGNEANFNEGCGSGILAVNTDYTDLDYTGTEDVTISGGSISNNLGYYVVNGVPTDNLFGGGALAALGLNVTVTGTTISGNQASTYGGGLYTIGNTLDVTNCTISGNTSSVYGGGIFTSYFMELIFDLGNYSIEAPDINISDGTISTNAAAGGGGVFMFGGNATQNQDLTYSYESHLYVDDEAVITLNNAGFGGGIFSGPSEIVIDGASQITGNNAYGSYLNGILITDKSGWGAGICPAWSSLELNDCMVSENVTEAEVGGISAGGGIYGLGQHSIFVNDENTLITGNISDYGGGIYTEALGELTISNGEISYNEANKGAGIFSNDSLTMDGGTITGNSGDEGGGIYSTATITINGGYIDENYAVNKATSDGGGIFSTNLVEINGGTISNNTAKDCGGGIYGKDVTFLADGTGVVSDNSATHNTTSTTRGMGGGLYIDSGTLTMSSGEIYGNYAKRNGGGVLLYNSTIVYISPASSNDIHDNTPNNVASVP